MPSTLVHVAFAALLAAALLGRAFDARSLGVVSAAAAFPDLDAFVGLAVPGAHRTLFHTLLAPAALALLLAAETRRERSALRARYGDRGVRVAWTALAALLLAGIGPDLFTNGVNAFWPVEDAFYALDGTVAFSTRRGVVQTVVEAGPRPTTETVHYATGVDPTAGPDPPNAERTFPVARAGWQSLVLLSAAVVGGVRLRRSAER